MSWYYGFRPYVSVAQRHANAAKAMAKLAKKGHNINPVKIQGRQIASTFWGKAWCENLEAYSDYANRLPRGRTYVRNGSVVDLQIKPGKVTARVSGSELYNIDIQIKPLAKSHWKTISSQCAGKIASVLELLQGRLSQGVMEIITHRQEGLFPKPTEISLDCSCPDSAYMCKHIAAALYGVGARLDEKPDLLFVLRQVDHVELIEKAAAGQVFAPAASGQKTIADGDLADVFGIEIDGADTPTGQHFAATPAQPLTDAGGAEQDAAGRMKKRLSPKKTKKPVPKALKTTTVVTATGASPTKKGKTRQPRKT